MKVVYPRKLEEAEISKANEISVKFNILRETAEILVLRGIDSVEKAERFFSAGKKWFLDPFDLSGIREAVNRIYLSREKSQSVLVFGDYDADGICATSVLCGCLRAFGIKPEFAIPEREDGYGLNVEKILNNGDRLPDLVITVDCGISDAEKIEILKKSGIDVIVTDHHEPPAVLPDCICINPKIKGQSYAFSGLCGCGVAYKLGRALIGESADEFLDFVALATIADSMDLVEENRDLVAEGLKIFNREPRAVFKDLLGDNYKTITAQTLAFGIAPKVNAGGRMGDAYSALKLFTAEKEREIYDLSAKLNGYNLLRQTECEEVFSDATRIVTSGGFYKDRVILVKGRNWKSGVIGIVAAKLVEVYDKPVIVFAKTDDYYKGSARSVDGVNIFDAVLSAKDLLLNFGGHAQAVGVSVAEENFEKLRKRINEYAEENFPERAEKTIPVDAKIDGEISMRFAKEIERLEPFGVANKRPVFAKELYATGVEPLKENSPHYKFTADGLEILDFNGEKDVKILSEPLKKTVVFELNVSVFKQKEYLKGYLRNIVYDKENLRDIDGRVFFRELTKDGGKEKIKTVSAKICKGYGTAYIVSDIRTLDRLPKNAGLNVYPYEITDVSGENSIVISPERISDKYQTAIYLDKPFLYRDFDGRSFRIEDPLFDQATGLRTDRSVFAEAFSYFAGKIGEPIDNVVKKIETPEKTEQTESATNEKDKNSENGRQYLFCFAVFKELGFFFTEKGILRRDVNVKRPLNESLLYRIAEERLC